MKKEPEKPRRDAIGELEGVHFEALNEAVDLSRRLALSCRLNRAVGLALAELRAKEGERRLSLLLRAENRKPAAPKARKGRNGPGR